MICFFNHKGNDSAFNLALEELLTKKTEDEIFFLWRNAPSVIIGRNQNTLAEINQRFIRENNIKVVRRNTGGGAVYHDLGNINYSYIVNYDDTKSINFADFAVPVIKTLAKMGLAAEFSGRNDLLLDGKKISGSAQSRIGNRILFHGTLLYNSNIDDLVNALNVSDVKISGKGIASVRSRVTNIAEHLEKEVDCEGFTEMLADALRSYFGTADDYIVPEDILAEAETLANEKYRTNAWNYGNSPEFNYEKSAKFSGGNVTLTLNIRKNMIVSAKFNGDFFSRIDVSVLEKALENAKLETENIENIVNSLQISEMFLNITAEEIISLFPLG